MSNLRGRSTRIPRKTRLREALEFPAELGEFGEELSESSHGFRTGEQFENEKSTGGAYKYDQFGDGDVHDWDPAEKATAKYGYHHVSSQERFQDNIPNFFHHFLYFALLVHFKIFLLLIKMHLEKTQERDEFRRLIASPDKMKDWRTWDDEAFWDGEASWAAYAGLKLKHGDCNPRELKKILDTTLPKHAMISYKRHLSRTKLDISDAMQESSERLVLQDANTFLCRDLREKISPVWVKNVNSLLKWATRKDRSLSGLQGIATKNGLAISYTQRIVRGQWVIPPELYSALTMIRHCKDAIWFDRMAKAQLVKSSWAEFGLYPYIMYPVLSLCPRYERQWCRDQSFMTRPKVPGGNNLFLEIGEIQKLSKMHDQEEWSVLSTAPNVLREAVHKMNKRQIRLAMQAMARKGPASLWVSRILLTKEKTENVINDILGNILRNPIYLTGYMRAWPATERTIASRYGKLCVRRRHHDALAGTIAAVSLIESLRELFGAENFCVELPEESMENELGKLCKTLLNVTVYGEPRNTYKGLLSRLCYETLGNPLKRSCDREKLTPLSLLHTIGTASQLWEARIYRIEDRFDLFFGFGFWATTGAFPQSKSDLLQAYKWSVSDSDQTTQIEVPPEEAYNELVRLNRLKIENWRPVSNLKASASELSKWLSGICDRTTVEMPLEPRVSAKTRWGVLCYFSLLTGEHHGHAYTTKYYGTLIVWRKIVWPTRLLELNVVAVSNGEASRSIGRIYLSFPEQMPLKTWYENTISLLKQTEDGLGATAATEIISQISPKMWKQFMSSRHQEIMCSTPPLVMQGDIGWPLSGCSDQTDTSIPPIKFTPECD